MGHDGLVYTSEGVMVVGGIWDFKSTLGLPMDVIFDIMKSRKCIPHFPEFIEQAVKDGVNPDKFMSEFRTAFIDVYGRDNWKRLDEWLKKYYEAEKVV